jgi:hypothetical protein
MGKYLSTLSRTYYHMNNLTTAFSFVIVKNSKCLYFVFCIFLKLHVETHQEQYSKVILFCWKYCYFLFANNAPRYFIQHVKGKLVPLNSVVNSIF